MHWSVKNTPSISIFQLDINFHDRYPSGTYLTRWKDTLKWYLYFFRLNGYDKYDNCFRSLHRCNLLFWSIFIKYKWISASGRYKGCSLMRYGQIVDFYQKCQLKPIFKIPLPFLFLKKASKCQSVYSGTKARTNLCFSLRSLFYLCTF